MKCERMAWQYKGFSRFQCKNERIPMINAHPRQTMRWLTIRLTASSDSVESVTIA